MKFLSRLIQFFMKAKSVVVTAKERIDTFIFEHRKQIRLMMTVFEALFPAKTGSKKMACVVSNVCTALGLAEYTEDVMNYIQDKCQEIYDELKEGLDNG